REPIGMSGVRLEAKIHIVTGSVSAAQNIVKCIERCDLRVSDVILQQLASSAAVLTDDEKELGVCLVDIGGGTTDIAVFTEGAIRHSAVIPIAGDQVTNDIAVALRTPTKHAEEIKIKHACALLDSLVDGNVNIEVPGTTNQRQAREISRKVLVDVVGARYEELFNLVLAELRRSGFKDLIVAGIVLTGGASQVVGAADLAERIFQLPVRIGTPQNIGGMPEVIGNPIYATGTGLLLTGYHHFQQGRAEAVNFSQQRSLWVRMKNWFQENF
ncbi:MAG: cell division protein FtsA, partial [Gammaproteobacteria bacterium RBG_16_37_9]